MHSSLNYQPSAPVKIKPKVEILTWKVVQNNGVESILGCILLLVWSTMIEIIQRGRIHWIGGTYRTSKTVWK